MLLSAYCVCNGHKILAQLCSFNLSDFHLFSPKVKYNYAMYICYVLL